MLRISSILCCVLPVILAVPFIQQQQHELNENVIDELKYKIPSPKELAEKAGYIAETHEVITEDRYVLQLDRITGSKKSPPSDKKPVVLLFHGLLDCSSTWVLADPSKSLGFLLADKGYDVWMGNARGNRYSRKHLDWTVSQSSFWQFSWHEIGIYDLPAMFDHILDKTKQKKIFVGTHSQGGTSFFVMASERPEYQEKIITAFTFAPAVFMSRTKNPFVRILAPKVNSIEAITKLIGLNEFKPSNELIPRLGKAICRDESHLQPVCTNVLFLIAGYNKNELNTTLLPTVTQYDPAGAASRQLVHYAQLVNSGKFQKFDHGRAANLLKYKSINPPAYNLRKIKTHVYLFYGNNDLLVDVEDTHQLYNELLNVDKFLVPSYAHLDFVWGKYANVKIYDKLFAILEKHKNEIPPSV